jgi:hypothetical protein
MGQIDPLKLQQENQQLEARLDSIREQHGCLKQM